MSTFFTITIVLTLIIVSGLVCQIFTINSESVFAHRSGCHRVHSCPSDTGSYVCGDLGNDSQCPGSFKKDNDKSSPKNNDKSSPKSDSNGDSSSSEINTANSNPNPTLPTPTLKEGIEISGPITYVVDGDTLDVNNIRIRLALVNTPELG
jgi:hypothetical protein